MFYNIAYLYYFQIVYVSKNKEKKGDKRHKNQHNFCPVYYFS